MERYERNIGTLEFPGVNVVASDQREIQQQLAKILASELFDKSPQLSRFLRFCVEQTLLGRQDSLKEQVLGTEVFRRGSPFDPRLDPIVRVEARRLRSKLEQYYLGQGAADPLLITFQRGDYIPRFVHAIAGSDKLPKTTQSARIIIVEDEAVVAKDLEIRLKGMGYVVVGSASSGEGALRAVDENQPDLVLMDIVLAGTMRGTEAARRIWSKHRIPVVYLTAFSDAIALEDVKDSDPYGYILKPFEPKQVHAVLQIALSRRAKECQDAATGGEKARLEALTAALENARVGTWEWLVTDPSLPFPESVAAPSRPVLSDREEPASKFLDGILPVDKDRIAAAFTEAIRNRRRIDVSYRRREQANRVEWVIATGRVVEDRDGQVRCSGLEIGANAAFRPDSARNVADLEQFVISAGRDLQEPLKTIKAYTQLLASRHQEDDPISESVLTHIEGGLDHMNALVSDLLVYAQLMQEETSPLEFISVDGALDLAIWNLKPAISESRAHIVRTSMPSLVANKLQIVQVFQNLLSNALKFRREDRTLEINASAARLENQWQFSFQDNGKDLDETQVKNAFQPFRPTNGAVHGPGLSLAICRRIVEHHGGRIWVEPNPGGGSAFHFTLPAAPGGVPSQSA